MKRGDDDKYAAKMWKRFQDDFHHYWNEYILRQRFERRWRQPEVEVKDYWDELPDSEKERIRNELKQPV